MKFLYIVFILCLPSLTFCQDKIAGKVVSEKGEALQGASVFISNTTIGVNTNAKGEFVLAKVPGGNTEIVVSYVGYEVTSAVIPAADRNKRYIIKLQLKSSDLATVIVGNYDKRGWNKWGNTFTTAFIGNSAYAKQCEITNKDVIRFNYNKKTNELRAYAPEPILIENKSLGYSISATLTDFMYDLSTKDVDYHVYSLFSEMQGTDDNELEWKKNREEAYSLSLMHFMRALYARNFKNEGFQVRIIERSLNPEKQRVEAIYRNSFSKIKDSLWNDRQMKESSVNKLVEKNFLKDSVQYYQSVLKQNDRTENLHLELCNFKDITSETDSGKVLLRFNDYLQVTYVKAKEPQEYADYKNKLYPDINTPNSVNQRVYPSTDLSLTHGIPLEINANGYFDNIDLYMQGFWGWWEKMATKLPYEYEP